MFFDLPVSSFWAYRSCLETVDNKSWLTFVKTWGGVKVLICIFAIYNMFGEYFSVPS
jgi:hypothetical protein